MGIPFISPADWQNDSHSLPATDRIAIGSADCRLGTLVTEEVEAADLDDTRITVLRRGVGTRATGCLNSLPAQVATLAVPVTAEDVVILPSTTAATLRSSAANRSLAESLFIAACDGNQINWFPVSVDVAEDSTALPALAPSRPPGNSRWQLDAVQTTLTLHPQAGSRTEAQAFAAALLQLNDWLDESHQASQSIEGEGRDRNGDYWHAIMHRREPDYGNSKYWFRRVGMHPIFPTLVEVAGEVLGSGPVEIAQQWRKRLITRGTWDSFAFVDMCEQAAGDEDSPLGLAARRIQFIEMLLLLMRSWGA